MSGGRRYDEPKLNIKKVIAVLLVFAVIAMIVVLIVKFMKEPKPKAETKTISNSYLSVFTNGKWGVINSKGDIVIDATYDSMVTIPDSSNNLFIVQTDVNLDEGTYNSRAINEKGETLFGSYEKVEAIQNIDENNSIFYDTNVLKVKKNGKYGLINYKGKEVLEPVYESIEPIKYLKNSFVTTKDNLKGLVDSSGTVIIENNYSYIQGLTLKYEDGYIVKNDSSKYGVINYNKKQVLNCKYAEIKNVYGSNMYVVKEGNSLELVDASGEVLLKDKFDDVISIDNNNLIIKSGENYGVITSAGNTKLNTEYQYLKYLFDGNYIAKKDGKFGIINLEGAQIVEFKYENITYMSKEGFIRADRPDGQTDLMNTEFQVKCSGIVSEVNSLNSFIKVRENGEYKYYNFKLEEQTTDEVYSANTLFLSKMDSKYGYTNKNGLVVVDYTYEDATEQNTYGYYAVKKNGKWGAIDSTGNIVVEPSLDLAQNPVISFIGKWHLAPDINANYYTDVKE